MTAAAKSYFWYHLRSKWKLLLLVSLLSFILTAVSAMDQKYEITHYDVNRNIIAVEVAYDSMLDPSFWIFVVCGYLFPITEFSSFLKRRNIDCLYALPVTRREIGIVHYTTGILYMIIPYTISYLTNFFLLLRYPGAFDYSPMLAYYLLSLLVGICAYSVNVFAFNQANSVIDGILFMAAGSCLLWLISFVNEEYVSMYNTVRWDAAEYHKMINRWLNIEITWMGNPWGTLFGIRYVYSHVIEKNRYIMLSDFWLEGQTVIWFALWIVLGTASGIGFIFNFDKRKVEKIGEDSDSWFGYKVLIPVYAVVLQIISDLLGIMFTLIFAFLAFVLFRKGFRLKKSDWITLGCLLVTGIILSIFFAQLTGQYIW